MKFKVGDKVILNKPNFDLVDSMHSQFGKEDTIISCEETPHGLYYRMNMSLWRWHESGLVLVEPQEYFYVGQTVYSPLFHNKDRIGVVVRIDKNAPCPVLCEGENACLAFTLDGIYNTAYKEVMLFQEPIQFPVNKPIERFEEGEIVEVSNCGETWQLGYFIGRNGKYTVSPIRYSDGGFSDFKIYKKIRKIK